MMVCVQIEPHHRREKKRWNRKKCPLPSIQMKPKQPLNIKFPNEIIPWAAMTTRTSIFRTVHFTRAIKILLKWKEEKKMVWNIRNFSDGICHILYKKFDDEILTFRMRNNNESYYICLHVQNSIKMKIWNLCMCVLHTRLISLHCQTNKILCFFSLSLSFHICSIEKIHISRSDDIQEVENLWEIVCILFYGEYFFFFFILQTIDRWKWH